mmetsp:Transcript_20675/g.39281  ORF Transcript_20675/g.39281 Transcript_20675/m.39281 type:complete len:251 (+) Transcript_20675:1275-2027(+)
MCSSNGFLGKCESGRHEEQYLLAPDVAEKLSVRTASSPVSKPPGPTVSEPRRGIKHIATSARLPASPVARSGNAISNSRAACSDSVANFVSDSRTSRSDAVALVVSDCRAARSDAVAHAISDSRAACSDAVAPAISNQSATGSDTSSDTSNDTAVDSTRVTTYITHEGATAGDAVTTTSANSSTSANSTTKLRTSATCPILIHQAHRVHPRDCVHPRHNHYSIVRTSSATSSKRKASVIIGHILHVDKLQ